MQNIFSKSFWNKQVKWNKKLSLLHFLATITLFSFTMILVTPSIFSEHHGDDGDPREEISGIAGAVGVIAGGVAWAGGIAAGTAAAPLWVPVAAGIGIGVGAVAVGVGLWDLFDGLEDDCNDCPGTGCNTCQPPDDDGCPNCDGSGYYMGDNCQTCNP